MENNDFIPEAIATGFFFLVGIIQKNHNRRITKIEEDADVKFSKLAETMVTKDQCVLREQLSTQKFDAIWSRFDELKSSNDKDHEKLEGVLEGMAETLREVRDHVIRNSSPGGL